MKTGVSLLVSGIFLLTSFNGCGKREGANKWEDKELQKILAIEATPIVLTDEERYEKENYRDDSYVEEEFWCNV